MNSMKILIVDDSVQILEMHSEFFKLMGDNIDTADNGQEAVKKISEGAYDVILLDLAMPEMSGFEVLERLDSMKKLEPKKIFILSAIDFTPKDQKNVKQYGIENVISKPINIHELYEIIKSRIQYGTLYRDLEIIHFLSKCEIIF